VCSNDCKIGVGGKGFCGLVYNMDGRLVRMGGTSEKGILQWYYDPLPTNCVAWWFCPGCTGAGYPKYAYKRGAETGYANLAVFYGACSYDCLFCQNWHYRNLAAKLGPVMSAESLAAKVDDHVSCICFFGGDPSVQMPHALKASQMALEKARGEGRIFRVCWETNGYWKEKFALEAAELSFTSGGNVKFDLKTWDENLNIALCGVSNKPTLESFKMIGEKFFRERSDLPILTASTLLIPGYVDVQEVRSLASFIAEVDSQIPYTLLAFYPQYVMTDLPTTSRDLAYQCYDVAKKSLKNVRIGNIHLLS
jgi:pyruvate formate lyase activating enzyme